MRRAIFGLFVVITLVIGAGYTANAQTLFCPESRISQFKGTKFRDTYDEAKKYTTSDVTDVSKMRVYVTAKDNHLYVQTNFRPHGGEYPLKLASDESVLDMRVWLSSLLGAFEEPTTGLDEAYKSSIPIYVDYHLFEDSRFGKLDFGEAKSVMVIGSDGEIRQSQPLKLVDGTFDRIIKYRESVFTRAGATDAVGAFKRFESQPFRKDDVRLLPLLTDAATLNKISADIPQANRIQFDFSSSQKLKEVLSQYKNRTVFPLGHIEDYAFVVHDAQGQTIFKLPIQQLNEMAKEYNVSIFPLGCNSAGASPGPGVVNAFNSVDAVGRFRIAMDAKNYGEFIDKLSSPGLLLVIDRSVWDIGNRRFIVSIYPAEVGTGLVASAVVGSLIIFVADDDWTVFFLVLLGGGIVTGGTAVYLYRRRRARSSVMVGNN